MATLQEKLAEISIPKGKVENITNLLSKINDCKKELEKCGIYLNENIETKQEGWNAYFGL